MSAQQGRREFRLLRKVSRGAEAGRMFVGHRVAQVLRGEGDSGERCTSRHGDNTGEAVRP